MADILREQRITNKNYGSEIVSALVLSNYGDPFLNENLDADILSTFLICMISSIDRIPFSNDQGITNKIVAVARPKQLQGTYGPITNNVTTQTRIDYYGNVNIGQAGSFSVNGISPINNPYQLGETIRIRKLAQPYNFPTPSNFFTSSVPGVSQGFQNYGAWYNQGQNLPYIQNTVGASNYLSQKPLVQIAGQPAGTYAYFINKYMYEAFMLNYNTTYNPQNVAGLTSIFAGNGINGNNSVYTTNGGYLFFNNIFSNNYYSIAWEDTNFNGKERSNENNSCLPLVVVTPNTYTTPSSRAAGSIQYSPSYSPVCVIPN